MESHEKQRKATNSTNYQRISTNTNNTNEYKQIFAKTNKYKQLLTNTYKYKEMPSNTNKDKQISTNTNKYWKMLTNINKWSIAIWCKWCQNDCVLHINVFCGLKKSRGPRRFSTTALAQRCVVQALCKDSFRWDFLR